MGHFETSGQNFLEQTSPGLKDNKCVGRIPDFACMLHSFGSTAAHKLVCCPGSGYGGMLPEVPSPKDDDEEAMGPPPGPVDLDEFVKTLPPWYQQVLLQRCSLLHLASTRAVLTLNCRCSSPCALCSSALGSASSSPSCSSAWVRLPCGVPAGRLLL